MATRNTRNGGNGGNRARRNGEANGTNGRRRDGNGAPTINLALQGGGSHGAFTWGVLDALLEDGRLGFEGISGASAGAMNAVMLTEGWRRALDEGKDPRSMAREHLAKFWTAVGERPSGFGLPTPVPWFAPPYGTQQAALMFDLVSRVFSPYQLNPFNVNPLRSVLKPLVDFDALRANPPFRLFVSATNVRTGRPRVFREHELKLDMLLASAALPFAFHAVEVDKEYYWDGGYVGNPSLYPLFYATRTSDLLLVQINPLIRDDVPDSAQEIIERVNEISFNTALLHELRAIAFVERLLRENKLDPARYKRVNMHAIDAEEQLRKYGASSKTYTSPGFLKELFELGRRSTIDWLERNFDYVGHTSSVRITERFL
ncbi:MAG TPA: patatin-like phospholipase family protein [Burkholderiaceae bacterium]|nr:patatin-like phospholipase family protein [Burkholderiaceae bacterium]